MTALVLLFALLLVVAALLWLTHRGTGTHVSHRASTTTTYRFKRLWWPRIVTRPG